MTSEAVFGAWWTPDRPRDRFTGQLTWDPPSAPVIELLDAPSRFSLSFDEPIPLLLGEADRFGRISLLDCRRASVGLASISTYSVSHVLTRRHLGDAAEPFIRRVEIEAPALTGLLGNRPVWLASRLSSRASAIRLGIDSRRHLWTSDGVDVEFKYVWAAWTTGLRADVQMTPRIALASATRRSLNWWFDSWLVPLSSLVQIASGIAFRPRSVRLWTKKHISRLERTAEYVSLWGPGIVPDEPDRSSERDDRHLRRILAPGQVKGLDIHQVMNQARGSHEKHEVFYDLLAGALFATDRPLRNRYLDVVTAIEANHAITYGAGPIDADQFKAQRRTALDSANDDATKKFLERWVPRSSSFSLEDRLRTVHDLVGGEWKYCAATMARLRNDIAHGNAHPDSHLLSGCFTQAADVARRLALHEMGVIRPPA